MVDDVMLNKAASIERCVARAPEEFALNFTRQDAAILNIQRAYEATLDIGQHIIRRESLGIPQSARDVFSLLARAQWIDALLAEQMKRMVGFRNVAVHDDQTLQLPITVNIITLHLQEFIEFNKQVLRKASA